MRPSTVRISACASGCPASACCTCSTPPSSRPRTVSPSGVARLAIGSALISNPVSTSLTLAALAASRWARSRSAASLCRIERRHPGHQRDDCCGRGQAPGVPPDELRGPVSQRVRTRADRLAAQVAPEVVGHRRHRGVALRRMLLERLGDDGIEIPAQHAAQPAWCGAAPAGMGQRAPPRPARCRRRPRTSAAAPRSTTARTSVAGDRMASPAGCWPVSSTYTSTPSAYTSVAVVTGPRVICSGAANSGVSAAPASRVSALVSAGSDRSHRAIALDQLGDAEVEQLHLSIGADEHVRRLDVPVHDQVGVCVRDRLEDVEEEPQPASTPRARSAQ